MSREVFVDTGAWVALADQSDNLHLAAREAYPLILNVDSHLVTTNLVVAETYNLLRRRLGAEASMRFLAAIGQSPRVHKTYSDEAIEREAEQILLALRDLRGLTPPVQTGG